MRDNIMALLKKVEADLNSVQSDKDIFSEAAKKLNAVLIDLNKSEANDLTSNYYIKLLKILSESYRELISLEKDGNLTTDQITLLNDLDEFDDFVVGIN